MSAWDNLSIRDKAEMMRVAIGNGITNINDIKREYNEFAEGGSIHIKPSHRGRLTELKERTGKTEAELYNDGNPAHKKMVVFARNARNWHDLGGNLSYDDGITYDGGTLPELQVTGYAPIRLTTYYPVVSKYPYTGHSELEVPIDTATWNTYKEDSVFGERTSPYLTINKGGSSRDYNLLTNNCADATLSYLNSAFNTKENPILFTTPGDVRDYAINTLGGKVVEGKEKGSDIVLIPRNADNYKQLSEDAVLWHNIHDPHSSAFSLKGPLKYNKRHSLGGSLYPDGGLLGNITRGMQVDTDQCATWSNGLLRNNGYLINGDAWRLNNVDTLFNGFVGLEKPAVYDRKAVEAYNHMASDNVYKNFDSKTLDKTQPYVVNMYYNNSPALEDAYNNGKGVTGTHTGILTYDNDKQKWVVTHNIHGKIHQENFVPLQSGKGKYGVTAIYQPREDNLVNRVKGFFGFANGGRLYPNGGKKQSLHPNVGRAMQYFMDKGFTDYQAAGLVGNLMRESSMSPTARNKWSGAYGLAQWLGDRRTNLFSKYGENPTFDQQLDYIWHELNSTHKNGLKNILASKTAEEAARNAMGYYEFSAGPEGAIRAMNKYGQDGEGSMRKGIEFANNLMGYRPTAEQASVIQQPQQPDPYAYQQQILDSLNSLSNAFNTLAPAVLSYKSPVKTPQVQEVPEEPKFNPASLLTQYQMLDSVL